MYRKWAPRYPRERLRCWGTPLLLCLVALVPFKWRLLATALGHETPPEALKERSQGPQDGSVGKGTNAKPHGLSSISRALRMEGENQLLKDVP